MELSLEADEGPEDIQSTDMVHVPRQICAAMNRTLEQITKSQKEIQKKSLRVCGLLDRTNRRLEKGEN